MSVDLSKMRNGEVFQHFLNQPQGINQKHSSYTLYEDLAIIMYLKDYAQISSRHFKEIEEKQIVHRSFYSIKCRYQDYLSKLIESDMNQIADYLRLNGAMGFIQFVDGKFSQISSSDARPQQSEKKKIEQTEGKKYMDPILPKNELDRFSVEDLDSVLQLLANHKNVPKSYLVDKLHQLSGNLQDLDALFQTNDDTNCFVEEEDKLLRNTIDNKSPALKLLIRKKGLPRVQRRLNYLKAVV